MSTTDLIVSNSSVTERENALERSPSVMGPVEIAIPTTGWFLAHDANCGFCSSLAEEITAIADGKLEVISLHDPVVQSWREEALGSDAPWAPTLMVAESTGVRAWTGKGLMIQMTRLIGPKRAWNVAQLVGGKVRRTETDDSDSTSLLDRRNMLKGLTGAAASLALLNGLQGQAAAEHPSDCHLSTINHWVNYRVNDNYVNCRECPFSWSPVDTQLFLNDLFGTKHITYSGWYVNGSSTWMRSRGTLGCWIHASYLY